MSKALKQTITTTLLFVFFASFLTVSLVSIIPKKAHAASVITDTIANQAYSYQAYVLLTRNGDDFGCGRWFEQAKDIGPDDARNLHWFVGKAGYTTRGGEVIYPGGGTGDCNGGTTGWLAKALQIWGYQDGNYTQFLKDIGYKPQADGGFGDNQTDLMQSIRNTIRDKYYNGNFSNINLTNAQKYSIYYSNFMTGCELDTALGPNPTPDNKLGDNVYAIKVVDSSGKVTTTYVRMVQGKQHNVTTGYNVGAPGDFEANCQWLAEQLNSDTIANAYATYIKANPGDTKAPTGGADGNVLNSSIDTGSGNGNSSSCYTISNPLTWILCPVVDLADGLYGWLTSQIKSLLSIDKNAYQDPSLEQSWAIFRNVASTLLVLVALAMIAGQVFNFEFMSAYTVKKVLPRLVIAAILIQLSWFIFTTMITIVNDIGLAVYSMLLAPFNLNGAGSDVVDLLGNASKSGNLFSGSLVLVGALGAGAAGFVAIGGLAGIVGLAVVGIFGIMAAIATLILRKILIILLLALAPLALVAWILPGTQKWWDAWWKLFSRLLIMFPLIMALLAAGRIAATILSRNDSGGAVQPFVVIIAYFMPLFLIPATFKFAGGIFASTSARINGLGKQWGRQSGNLAKGKTIESVGRLARNRNNRFTRGLNYASHGAVTSRQRSRAAETSRAAIHEREKNFQSLVEARTAGMDRGRKHAELLDIINNGSEDMAEGAARILAAERGWNQMDNLNARGLHRVREIAANDPTGFGSSLWSSRRDIADGPADRISTMSANDAAGQHSSFFTAGNVNQLDPRTAADLTRNQTLMSALNADTQELIYQRAGIPNPITGGGGNPARGGAPAPAAGGGGNPAGGNPAAGGGNRGQAGGNTPPRVINLTQGTTGAGTTGAATMLHTASNVQTQINNAGGMSSLSSEEVIDIYNHADRNWRNDTEGTQIGMDALDELRNRGVFPPQNNNQAGP
jgi:hypothetical protein